MKKKIGKPGMDIIRKFLFIIFILFTNNIFAATITAQLDVNPVLINDSFHLIYTAEGSVDGDPDFSPINKDFKLRGTQQSSNLSVINGNFQRTKKWILTLIAKKTGTFRIPPISFGTDKSPEVEIVVKEVPVSNSSSPTDDFFIEIEADNKSIFVQQQALITVRLYIAKNITSYQFADLETSNPDTIIEQLSKDKQYKTYRGAKPYIIFEKQYALFPQHAGTLDIKSLAAEIGIATRTSSGRFFDPFNANTITKRLRSKPLTIKVKAIPSTSRNHNWMPTPSLKLVEDWPRNTTFKVGEPITRTLTLIADGLTSSQLTEVKQPAVNGINQYPDKALLQDNTTPTGITSTRKQKIALIPTRHGTYTLPAIDIPWWNTKKSKIDIAHISTRTFKVIGTAQTDNTAPISNTPLNETKTTNQTVLDSTTFSSDPSVTSDKKLLFNIPWFWLSILFFVLWLFTILLWLRARKQTVITNNSNEDKSISISTSLKYLKSACGRNNPQDTKTALLGWGQLIFNNNPPNNLAELAEKLDSPIKELILNLNTFLYSNNKSDWKCGELYTLCKGYDVTKHDSRKENNNAKLEPFKL